MCFVIVAGTADGDRLRLCVRKQEDMVCLSCTATGERVMLAAEGFGNRHCFLENIADKNIPPDLSQCVFVIEQALSVRALQELVTAAGSESVSFSFVSFSLVLIVWIWPSMGIFRSQCLLSIRKYAC